MVALRVQESTQKPGVQLPDLMICAIERHTIYNIICIGVHYIIHYLHYKLVSPKHTQYQNNHNLSNQVVAIENSTLIKYQHGITKIHRMK